MEQNFIEYHEGGGASYVGPRSVNVFRATVIAHAIEFFLRTGLKVNRAYTPTNMRAAASDMTGQTYKGRKGLEQAAKDLRTLVEKERGCIPHITPSSGDNAAAPQKGGTTTH